jgi:hypothetical protein
MAKKIKPMKRWLVANVDSEVFVWGGPYSTQRKFGEALIKMIQDSTTKLESDQMGSAHILCIENGVPDITDFSNMFMEAARRLAFDESEHEPADLVMVMED